MSNPNPSPATRFPAGTSGNRSGRPSSAWIRRFLAKKDGDRQRRLAVLAHLYEVATKWEVLVVGHGDEPLEVASARDSVEAAKLILAYDLGTPRKQEDRIELPEGLDPQAPLLDLAAAIYRHRMLSGRMGESEFADMVKAILSVDDTKIRLILKILGPNAAGKSEDEIRALLTGVPAPAAREPAPPANVEPAKTGEAEGARESKSTDRTISPGEDGKAPDGPSPKDRDMADHGSGCENGSIFAGADGAAETNSGGFHVSHDDDD